MAETKLPGVPQDMRELAISSIEQFRTAYSQLMDAGRKAQEMMKTVVPSNPVVQVLSEAQERTMRFTQQSLDASFALAEDLAKAKDLSEALQIQSRYAQDQMHAFALQAQELARTLTDSGKKGKP